MQTPAVHVFVPLAQGLPSALSGFVQVPPTPQVPTLWQSSSAVQTTGVLVHAPAWQVSGVVQALPSVHTAPLAFGIRGHRPVAGAQVETSWH